MSSRYQNLLTPELTLKNKYYIVRHGESLANVAGIVSSIYKVSVAQHGLTEKGQSQALGAGDVFRTLLTATTGDSRIVLEDIVIYASDFARAYETGYYLRESLITASKSEDVCEAKEPLPKSPGVALAPRLLTHPSLRERFFGDFEGKDHTSYEHVWAKDITEPIDSTHYNVESIASVVDRTSKLIVELEETWHMSGKHIVLVSHGDICQILLTAFGLKDARTHRSIPHMKNCDVRSLVLGTVENHSE